MRQAQIPLLIESCKQLYGGIGWPLLAMCTLSAIYCAVKYPWKLALAIAPLIIFYILIITRISFVVPRFLLAGYPGLAMLAGVASAKWIRWKTIPNWLRIAPIVFVYSMSLLFCIALDMEMLSDSRERTEQWFHENVSKDKLIGAGIYNKVYAPRLHLQGYQMVCPWKVAEAQSTSVDISMHPDYLIMPPKYPCTEEDSEQEFRRSLLEGTSGYKQVAAFKESYLYPSRNFLGFAGWPIQKLKFLSPEMIVFEKQKSSETKSSTK